MIDLKKIFENHFDSKNISDNRLRAFSEDHISKLSAWLTQHVDAELTALRDELVLKHTAYFGAINSEKAKFNLQQSRTKDVENAWEKVLDFIRFAESIIIFKWGREGAVYQEFFPQGITEYTRATKLNKAEVLSQFLAAATAHAVDLPANFAADFTALETDWQTKYDIQQAQIGLVKDANTTTADKRQPVEEQLAKHVLSIALKNISKPDMVSDFFSQSIIRQKKSDSTPADEIIVRGKVTVAGTTTPVVNARVVLTRATDPILPGIEAFTDEKGRYTITVQVTPGESGMGHITIDVPGFNTFNYEFEGHAGHSYNINPALTQGLQKVA